MSAEIETNDQNTAQVVRDVVENLNHHNPIETPKGFDLSKAHLITVPDNARILAPAKISDPEKSWIAAVSNEGRMLVFPAADLPQMARGKGNKMISINSAKAAAREELMVGAVAFSQEDTLLVYAGKRHLKLKFADLEHYLGERGRRRNKLPRGFQNDDLMEVVSKDV